MSTLFNIFHSIQNSLFPWLEETLDPLTEKEQRFVQVVSLMDLQAHMAQYDWQGKGRKRKDRTSIAKAFTAKAIYNFETTEILIEYLHGCKNLRDLSSQCDVGTKKNSKGYKESWTGYKLHIDCIDGDIPVSTILTSASLHDSQAAIPLAQMSAERVTNLYDLMDSAYDASQIHNFSESLGHKAIIDNNPRRGKKVYRDPATDKRFGQRSSVERVNSYLKDNYGGRNVRVKGSAKVMTHLMFGIIVITATQLFRLLT